LNPNYLGNMSVLAIAQLVSFLTTVPIVMFFTLAGLCVLSWMQVFHVSIRNKMTEFEFEPVKKKFIFFLKALDALTCILMLCASYVQDEKAALRIYQVLMIILASLSLLLSMMFIGYGIRIYEEIAHIHARLAKNSSMGNSHQLAAAVRTQFAGMIFCICCLAASSTWIAYAILLNDEIPNENSIMIISTVRYSSELSMVIVCVWLYKNAIPTKSVLSKNLSIPENKALSSKAKQRAAAKNMRAHVTSDEVTVDPNNMTLTQTHMALQLTFEATNQSSPTRIEAVQVSMNSEETYQTVPTRIEAVQLSMTSDETDQTVPVKIEDFPPQMTPAESM